MIIDIKKLDEQAVVPTRGSDAAAGYDLHAILENDKLTLWPHETVKIRTGIAMAIPDGYFGAIFARSGLAAKNGLRPANCVGVIDADYRGEIIVALHNDTELHETIENGTRIAQLVIMPFLEADFKLVETLPETERGAGGFGSTDTKEEYHQYTWDEVFEALFKTQET